MIQPIEHTTTDEMGGTKERYVYAFENGWGASIIKGPYSYGGSEGFWELAVTHGWFTDDSHVCYQSGITDDVIGWLPWGDVQDHLEAIAALPFDDPHECEDNVSWEERIESIKQASAQLKQLMEES